MGIFENQNSDNARTTITHSILLPLCCFLVILQECIVGLQFQWNLMPVSLCSFDPLSTFQPTFPQHRISSLFFAVLSMCFDIKRSKKNGNKDFDYKEVDNLKNLGITWYVYKMRVFDCLEIIYFLNKKINLTGIDIIFSFHERE